MYQQKKPVMKWMKDQFYNQLQDNIDEIPNFSVNY